MFDRFSHFLSYGATDQLTARELVGSFDGLVVPGTVAAFQRDGTGGFVLTLSATTARPEYVIDPRFPLFQQRLSHPKRAHRALAELVGDPNLVVEEGQPSPEYFSDEIIGRIAAAWVEFNRGYSENTISKFSKYARRLNEEVALPDVQPPAFILPPYFVAANALDPWLNVSLRLYEAARDQSDVECVPVVATTNARELDSIASTYGSERYVIWVSNLPELDAEVFVLRAYAQAISTLAGKGASPFALYGGFFSVLLSHFGLVGSSHGIGYGEYRAWPELPQSGPPPARYYLPAVHRYVSQELAYQLWLTDRELIECHCAECDGQPPIALEYHSLMKHSVLCRAAEIEEWTPLATDAMVQRLARELERYEVALSRMAISAFARQGERASEHLPRWIAALE